MKSRRLVALSSVLALWGILGTGCTTKLGGYVPQSKFDFPNSNVTPLGPAKATVSKTSFFLSPKLGFAEVDETYRQALAQVPGANILVNYTEDTSYTSVFLINTVKYTIDGTAAQMDVGQQGLK